MNIIDWFSSLSQTAQATVVAALITGTSAIIGVASHSSEHLKRAAKLLFMVGATAVVVMFVGLLAAKQPSYPPPAPINGTKELVGFFGDVSGSMDDNNTYVSKEKVILMSYESTVNSKMDEIVVSCQGKVKNLQGQMIDKTWQMRGFSSSDELALCYATSSSSSNGFGTGVYYLRNDGTGWVGIWRGRDQITGKTIEGPYVLVPSDDETRDLTPEQAEKKYPVLQTKARLVD